MQSQVPISEGSIGIECVFVKNSLLALIVNSPIREVQLSSAQNSFLICPVLERYVSFSHSSP
jgi:hypothetical protein